MLGRSTLIAISVLCTNLSRAQQPGIDSLHHQIISSGNDTVNLLLLEKISIAYSETHPDSAYYYASQMLAVEKKLALKFEEVSVLGAMEQDWDCH